MRVKLLFMDVDGTLTDGRIHISPQGEIFKSFDAKDGYAIRHILPRFHIIPAVITGRRSEIVEIRCRELGVSRCFQGVEDKAGCLRALAHELGIPLEQTACIGDDENDLPMITLCGVKGCPSDAVDAVKEICDYVCARPGGRGAVREFSDWLVQFYGE